jgi:hypothetical protein
MEFSAFFDLTTNNLGDQIIYLKYFLFIKYKNNIYIDVKNVGYITMPFEELMKNKLLKMYYELSLLLVKDKNRFVEKIDHDGKLIWDDEITNIYKGRRYCFVDCAYILNDVVKTDKQYCYYEMNPYELKYSSYSMREGSFNIDQYTDERKVVNTSSEIEFFNYSLMGRLGHEVVSFEKRVINYTNLIVDYNATLMEKELDEISAAEDDKINIIKLIAFNDKKGMNRDIFQVFYSYLICSKVSKRYAKYLEKLENNKEVTIALIASV